MFFFTHSFYFVFQAPWSKQTVMSSVSISISNSRKINISGDILSKLYCMSSYQTQFKHICRIIEKYPREGKVKKERRARDCVFWIYGFTCKMFGFHRIEFYFWKSTCTLYSIEKSWIPKTLPPKIVCYMTNSWNTQLRCYWLNLVVPTNCIIKISESKEERK